MPVEIEAKVKVDDLRPVREALLAAGARRISKVRELNTYFACGDPDCGLRTRREVDEQGNVRGRVTFKGPRQQAAYKQREEIEYDASDTDAAGRILERLGHAVALRFEKDRETFELDDCEVVLDELPRLGTFVEVEGPSEASVRGVLGRLNLGGAETLTAGYASMISDLLSGTGETELRFD